jgi:hypothetical protein
LFWELELGRLRINKDTFFSVIGEIIAEPAACSDDFFAEQEVVVVIDTSGGDDSVTVRDGFCGTISVICQCGVNIVTICRPVTKVTVIAEKLYRIIIIKNDIGLPGAGAESI